MGQAEVPRIPYTGLKDTGSPASKRLTWVMFHQYAAAAVVPKTPDFVALRIWDLKYQYRCSQQGEGIAKENVAPLMLHRHGWFL